MKLTPPKQVVFKWALALAVVGLIAVVASFFVAFEFTLLIGAVLSFAAWALLAAGNALKGF